MSPGVSTALARNANGLSWISLVLVRIIVLGAVQCPPKSFRVTTGGQPISTGVLIVASQSSFTNPPSLSSSTLTGPAYYTSNSYEDGTYILEVRGSTTTPYNVRAYYPVFSGDTPTTMTGSYSNVWVNQGGITPNINFSW